jgi:hypothetical protein
MAWNPLLLNGRAAHVRPVTRTPSAEKESPAQQTHAGKEA